MRAPLATLAVVATLACSGCFAVSARAHVGAVTGNGKTGVQVGLTLGLGLTTSKRGGVLGSVAVVSGNAPKLGVGENFEYVRVPDRDAPVKVAWRFGFGGEFGLIGNPSLLGPHVASIIIVRDKYSSSSGHEKFGGGGWDRSLLGVGLEARAGLAVDREPAMDPTQDDILHRGAGASLAATVEWTLLMQGSLF